MHILLINTNPVVSRLFSLCINDENMLLEEVDNATDIKRSDYAIVFVDEGSYEGDVLRLNERLNIGKKVLLSNADVLISDFDMNIQKPFLPSQIIEVLESMKGSELAGSEVKEVPEVEENTPDDTVIFPLTSDVSNDQETQGASSENEGGSQEVLDAKEIEKIKALLDMDVEDKQEKTWSDEAYEKRKMEVIKEQLIAEGLEIVEEDDIVEELSQGEENADVMIFEEEPLDDETEKSKIKSDKNEKQEEKVQKPKKEKKKKKDFTAVELAQIEGAIESAITKIKPKKMKKLLKGKEIKVTVKIEEF